MFHLQIKNSLTRAGCGPSSTYFQELFSPLDLTYVKEKGGGRPRSKIVCLKSGLIKGSLHFQNIRREARKFGNILNRIFFSLGCLTCWKVNICQSTSLIYCQTVTLTFSPLQYNKETDTALTLKCSWPKILVLSEILLNPYGQL